MSPFGAILLGLTLVGPSQLRPRPQTQALELDPFLWEELEEVAARAWAAERDPKRGPGNALSLLDSARAKQSSPRHQTALDLRKAAVALRQRFRTGDEFSEAQREAQALSTYSRLDLADPGLGPDLRRALSARRRAVRGESQRGPRVPLRIRAVVLSRTASLDKRAFTRKLKMGLEKVGVSFVSTAPADAEFILKIAARNVETRGSERQVSVRIDLEQIEDKRTTWRHALFRTTAAPTAKQALAAGLEWLARIGGRDLLFRYLSDGPLPDLRPLRPAGSAVDPHGH